MSTLPVTRLVRDLPATTPFVGPEALERQLGQALPLRLGANESAFGISPLARQAMQAAVARVSWYGDPEGYALRVDLARRHGVTLPEVGLGSGIDDLLGLAVRAFLDRDEVAITSLGAYPTFNYHVAGYGGVLHRVAYRNYRNDLDALAEAASQVSARLVYLANPDNPTGSRHSASDVAVFLDRLPAGCVLILDEAYADFVPPDELPAIDVADPRVMRLRTFSKAHGMAGARIGYVIAAREIIEAFDKIRLHFGINIVAQEGALASLYDPDFMESVVLAVQDGRQEYAALAERLGLMALPSATNFVAIDMGSAERARATLDALLRHGVFVRMPGVAPLDRCIRVTVGTPAQRDIFGAIFEEICATT